jgi:hypothetical protein
MEMQPVKPGSTKEKKTPTRITINHDDMPELGDASVGDEVEFHGKGHVKAQRAADEFGPATSDIEVNSMKHHETKKKGRDNNAAKMPMDELKKSIKEASEKDNA